MEKFIGFILPPLIDLINRKLTDSDLRFWVSTLLCALVGVGIFAVSGQPWNLNGIFDSIVWTFGLAQFSYKGLWENSGIRDNLNLKAK